MPNQRDISIDVAKGICIFLMVMGHAAVPVFIFKWIYSFHMPFFLSCQVCSLILLNTRNGHIS